MPCPAQLLAANLELALDRRGEFGLGLRVIADHFGGRVEGQAFHRRFEQRPGIETMLLQESQSDEIAREQELHNRLAIGSTALIEADGSALYAKHLFPQIARLEQELIGA